ncbi:MAG: class I SAM-dependent methyltransferase [Bacteroidota bacterium]
MPHQVPKAEFDHFADDYDDLLKKSITASGFEPTYFDEHKIKTIYDDYISNSKFDNSKLQILNFGCGIGKSEKFINKYFIDSVICSVDVSEKSINTAKEKNKQFKNIEFIKFDTVEDLKLNTKFDIIFVANVFHHIPEDLHLPTLKYLRLLLSSNGYLYVFEHNPKNPLTRKVFETCEFDIGCKMISPALFIKMCADAGYSTIIRRYILFFPKIFAVLSRLEKNLKWCPLGAQYYIKAK